MQEECSSRTSSLVKPTTSKIFDLTLQPIALLTSRQALQTAFSYANHILSTSKLKQALSMDPVLMPESTLQQKQANAQLQSQLSRLPTEVRFMIYEHVFTFEGPIRLRKTHADKPSCLDFLLTCRMVLYEAEPIFYQLNRLITNWRGYKTPFTHSVSLLRRQAITRVVVRTERDSPSFRHAMIELRTLRRLPNLRSVYFTMTRSHLAYLYNSPYLTVVVFRAKEEWAAEMKGLSDFKVFVECSGDERRGMLLSRLVDGALKHNEAPSVQLFY